MIKVKKIENKIYEIYNNKKLIITLNLLTSSITNKFNIITNYIESLSENLGDEFDNWLVNFLTEYENNYEQRFSILMRNTTKIMEFVDSFFAQKNFDYSQFINEEKAKKTTIFFTLSDVKYIIRCSNYLKIYSLISNSELKLNNINLHKQIYNVFITDLIDNNVVYKILNVIKTKTFRCKLTDKFMWDYIKMIKCKDSDDRMIEIFNFIMNNILILCEEDKNPITYFVTVVDSCLNWFLRTVYKDTIIYNDMMSTEDIQTINTNNLKAYCYNDTLARVKSIAIEKIYKELQKDKPILLNEENVFEKEPILEFQTKIEKIQYISPAVEFLAFPILSQILGVPYQYFNTINPPNAAVLSLYTHRLLKNVFMDKFSKLFSLLLLYPIKPPPIATTYKIKQVKEYLDRQNTTKNFFGFKTKLALHKSLCIFIGKVSRSSFVNIITGEEEKTCPVIDLEKDAIDFYSYYFSNTLTKEIEEIKRLMFFDF